MSKPDTARADSVATEAAMPQLIDKQWLLESLKKELNQCSKLKFQLKDRFYLGRETVLRDIVKMVESGVFDIEEVSP